jgi:hypothetical protein
MVEYTYDDIDSWLVEYTNKNEDIETTLQNLSIDLREIESELFNIKDQARSDRCSLKRIYSRMVKQVYNQDF